MNIGYSIMFWQNVNMGQNARYRHFTGQSQPLGVRKTAATSMKIGDMTLRARHDMTRKYTAAVNRVTSSEQVTDAARELAKDILRETGNEVNGKNVSRVMGAAMGVRSGEKTTPNAEMRMSGLRYDKNSPAVNEGLNLLGGLVNEIARADDTEQYMRLFSEGEEKSGEKYSIKIDDVGPIVIIDVAQEKFEGKSKSKMAEIAKQEIIDRFVDTNAEMRFQHGKARLYKPAAKEYIRPAKQVEGDLHRAKLKAAPEYDKIVEIGEYIGSGIRNPGHHPDVYRWDYYATRFDVNIGDKTIHTAWLMLRTQS